MDDLKILGHGHANAVKEEKLPQFGNVEKGAVIVIG
jgi:hypothetical protein